MTNKKVEKLNTYRILSLGILGLLALGLLAVILLIALPKEASAQYNNPRIERTFEREFELPNARPNVYSLNPNPVRWGSGRTSVTVYGDGFAYGAVVRLNNQDRTTIFKNSKELNFELLSSDTLRLGEYWVTVYNPGPGGGISNGVILRIVEDTRIAGGTVSGTYPGTASGVSSSGVSQTGSGASAGAATGAVAGTSTDKDTSALVASAIYGSGEGFMPSGLTQWLIIAILILLAIIAVRKLYFEKKFHSEPLKHA